MTIKIHIHQLESRLEAPSEIVSAVSEKLTFRVEGSQFSPLVRQGRWDGKKRFLIRPANKFKTGLVPRVLDLLPDGSTVQILDYRTNVPKFDAIPQGYTLPGETAKTLRDYQVDSVNAVLTRTVGGSVAFPRGVINVATNGGKTVMASAIINEFLKKSNKKLLFVTHSKEIGLQAKASFEIDLGIKVGYIGAGVWDCESQVIVAMIPTLVRNLKKDRYKELIENIGGFIADETHHAVATTWHTVLMGIDCELRIGLTGTVDSKKPITEHLLYEVTSTKAIIIDNQFLIDCGVSSKPYCYFIPVKGSPKTFLNFAEAYREVITCNEKRNYLVGQIVKKEFSEGKNILVMVEHLEHGENIMKVLEECFPEVTDVVFTHGGKSTEFRQKVLTDLREGKLRVVVATAILDEGVDVSGLHAIIYARAGKSFRKVLQSIGRVLRKKQDHSTVNVYDFIDYGDKILLEHSKERYRIVKKQGFEVEIAPKL